MSDKVFRKRALSTAHDDNSVLRPWMDHWLPALCGGKRGTTKSSSQRSRAGMSAVQKQQEWEERLQCRSSGHRTHFVLVFQSANTP